MRARVLLPLLGLAAAGLTALPPVMSASASAAATVRVVVKPVTASGHPAPGFTVHRAKHAWERVDCSFKDPSVGAVSPDVEACSPSAAYAIACWKSADPGRVLCTRDPSSHALYELPRDGKFAKTAVAQPRDRAPLLIILRDGTRCQIRDGGAWGPVPHHPNLYGAYSCDHHNAAWLYAKGSHNDPHAGIDESKRSWRIRTGYRHIVWRHIAEAYFVATAS